MGEGVKGVKYRNRERSQGRGFNLGYSRVDLLAHAVMPPVNVLTLVNPDCFRYPPLWALRTPLLHARSRSESSSLRAFGPFTRAY